MSFPLQFAEPGNYFAPFINFTGNAVVVAVAGIGLGAISYLALKALGFSEVATTIAAAIPVTIGAFAGVGAIIGGGICLTFVIAVIWALTHRH